MMTDEIEISDKPEILIIKTNDLSPFKFTLSDEDIKAYVDRNFFGTTAIFIKTSESSQEEYCIEDDKIVDIANENIGKKVTVKYGKRVGIYSTGRCNQGPIESIKLAENE